MSSWIFILVVYAFGLVVLARLGGLGSAADALRRWGAARGGLPVDRVSSGT